MNKFKQYMDIINEMMDDVQDLKIQKNVLTFKINTPNKRNYLYSVVLDFTCDIPEYEYDYDSDSNVESKKTYIDTLENFLNISIFLDIKIKVSSSSKANTRIYLAEIEKEETYLDNLKKQYIESTGKLTEQSIINGFKHQYANSLNEDEAKKIFPQIKELFKFDILSDIKNYVDNEIKKIREEAKEEEE